MSLLRDLSIDVSTLSPLAATAFAWHIAGATRVTVIAKATFEIVPSASAKLVRPEPLCSEDKYDPSTSALRTASEMSPHLPNAGIVLSGSAYVPPGADRVTVSLGIHRYGWLVHKRVVLPSPRAASAAEPAVRMPLGSAGFGPVSASVSPRRDLTPHIVPHPLGVPQLPPNVDFRYFQSAPPDQQCAYLEGDEWIMLEGVHPTSTLLRTQLPSVRAEARLWLPPTAESAASERGLRLVADTVLVDTDRLVLQMVWRGHIEVSRADVPAGMTAYVGLSRPDAAVDFPRRPPRPKPALAGTTAVSDVEIARSREAAAAPFRIGGPDAIRAAPAAIPGAPFQRPSPSSPPAPVVPVSAAVFETVAIAPSVVVTEALSAKPDVIVGVPETPSDGPTGRKRPRPVLGQTLEQRDKPPDRPIAPFAIADAGVSRGPTAPIPGAPFLAPPGEGASNEFVAVEPPPPLPEIPAPSGVFETVALAPPVAPPAAFVSEPPPAPVEPAPPAAEPPPVAASIVESLAATAPVAAEPPPTTAAPTLRDTVVARVRSGTPMFDLNLVGADLSDLDLTGARLSQQNLRDVRFSQSKLVGAELAGTDLTNVDLSKADLSGADLSGARMMRSNLTETRLVGASLERADLTGATLTQACLDQARLTETNLSGTQAVRASFRGALLGHADLRTARFSNANFDGANLDNVAAGRADFSGAQFVRASLANAVLRGVRMPAAMLAFANVTGADFRDADLRGANVHGVDRTTGKFGGANLRDIVDEPPPDAADE